VTDHVDSGTRSAIMAKVKSRDTRPEMKVRSALHRAGYRYRLHRSDLPGNPDLTFPRFRLVLFVHGCFWHRHGCKRTTMPASNLEFWSNKFRRTMERDRKALKELKETGWATTVIWECQIEAGIGRLIKMLTGIARLSDKKPGSQRV